MIITKQQFLPEFNLITFEIDEALYGIQLWDISGQNQNQNETKVYTRDSLECIVMTDATNVETRKK